MGQLDLTQTELNASLRGLTDVDILMFLPDKSIHFPSNAVTLNTQAMRYTSNLQSVIELSRLPQANIATFENNSWILDGSFISPSEGYGGGGDSYTGYISDVMTNDNGDYVTNPVVTVKLAAIAPVIHYLSIKFAGGIDTSYPKVFKIRTYNGSSLIREHVIDMTTQTGLPLLVAQIEDTNVNSVQFEFVGTQCPHRRSRLNKVMFGKTEQVIPNYLQSWKVDDKASLVADSIPTKKFDYNIINYNGDYNIDNPGNKIPNTYRDVQILFTFMQEVAGLWKYAPVKTFNLIDISTTPEGVVTFSCGSILDTLTDTYDQDLYNGVKTVQQVMDLLLAFSGVGIDQCILNEFGSYKINIPLPELPVREIIQRLAFSCGATLTVDDNNRIVFSKKNIIPVATTPKFMFHRPEPFNSAGILLEEPNAEALANTTNIAMYTYDTREEAEVSELGTINVSTITPVKITFSPAVGAVQFDIQSIEDQFAHIDNVSEMYSQHAIVQLSWTGSAVLPIKLRVLGKKAITTQAISKTVSMDTLLLDSGLALSTPSNLKRPTNPDPSTFYYTDWYGAKFKYKCKTRNEYLIKAGDIILFETPFSNGEPIRVGYVLRNAYSNDGDSGEMEVVTIGNS